MEYNFSDYSSDDLKILVEEKPFSNFVVDDFLDKNLFLKLDEDYRKFYDKYGVSFECMYNLRNRGSNTIVYSLDNGKKLNHNHPLKTQHKIFSNNKPITTWFNTQKTYQNTVHGHTDWLSEVDDSYRMVGANVHHNDREYGVTIDYGGNGRMIDSFQALCNFSPSWKSFLNIIYSNEFFEYMFNIFDETSEYKDRIGNKKIKKCHDNKVEDNKKLNYFVGTKINSYTDNYGWYLHPDTPNKVLSFLLYLDNTDWPEDTKGNGTQLWGFGDEDTVFDTKEQFQYNGNSIDFQLRDARDKESGGLLLEQQKKIKIFKDINFKPNRLVGFIRSDNSWHSILPMKLPKDIFRNCFQINVWRCDDE